MNGVALKIVVDQVSKRQKGRVFPHEISQGFDAGAAELIGAQEDDPRGDSPVVPFGHNLSSRAHLAADERSDGGQVAFHPDGGRHRQGVLQGFSQAVDRIAEGRRRVRRHSHGIAQRHGADRFAGKVGMLGLLVMQRLDIDQRLLNPQPRAFIGEPGIEALVFQELDDDAQGGFREGVQNGK